MTLKSNCDKFNGKIVKGKCMIDGYPMSKADFLFDYKPNSQQFKVMKPQEFLDIVPTEPFRNPDTHRYLKKRLKEKKPTDPLFIDVDVDSCKVLGHEGRNRATVSKELGIKVPVIVFNKEFDAEAKGMFGRPGIYFYTNRKNKCKKFIKQ